MAKKCWLNYRLLQQLCVPEKMPRRIKTITHIVTYSHVYVDILYLLVLIYQYTYSGAICTNNYFSLAIFSSKTFSLKSTTSLIN